MHGQKNVKEEIKVNDASKDRDIQDTNNSIKRTLFILIQRN